MTMELRQLRSFRALAQTLNFTRAAEAVHVSQSTLSHQIRQLEEALGQPLFLRTTRRMSLTHAGETLLDHAVRALAEVDRAVLALSDEKQDAGGELRLGATPTFGIAFLPECARRFHEQHPSIKLVIEECGMREMEQGVADGALAFGICYRSPQPESLRFEPLFNEELMLAVGPEHPLAKARRVRMIDLHGMALALPPPEFSTRQLLDELFESVGATPEVVAEFSSIASTTALVERSKIASVLSEHAVHSNSAIRMIPIESPNPLRTPGLLWRRKARPDPLAQAFAGLLRDMQVDSRWIGRRRGAAPRAAGRTLR